MVFPHTMVAISTNGSAFSHAGKGARILNYHHNNIGNNYNNILYRKN